MPLDISKLSIDPKDAEVIQTAFNEAVDAERIRLKEEHEAEIATLQENTATIIEEAISEVYAEVQTELVEARTLDVRYATKLVEQTDEIRAQVEAEARIELAEAVTELEERLVEDANLVRQNKHVMNIITALNENAVVFGGQAQEDNSLTEAERTELQSLRREKKINELTEGLDDRAKRIANNLLADTLYENLETRFEKLQPMIVEGTEKVTDTNKPLNEGVTTDKPVDGVVVNENQDPDADTKDGKDNKDTKQEQVNENAQAKHSTELEGILKRAGIRR